MASPPLLPLAYAASESDEDGDDAGPEQAPGPAFDGGPAYAAAAADVIAPYPDSPTPIPSSSGEGEGGGGGGGPATAPYPPSPPPPPEAAAPALPLPPSLAAPPPGSPPPSLVDRLGRMLATMDRGAPTLAAALRGSRAYRNPAFLEALVAAAGPPDPHACPLPWWRGSGDLPAEDTAAALDATEAAARAARAAGEPRKGIEFQQSNGGGGGGGAPAQAAALAAARAAAARAAAAGARPGGRR